MSDQPHICPVCRKELSSDVITTLGQKGCDTFNKASSSRGSTLILCPGTKLHRRCHQRYTNPKSVSAAAKQTNVETQPGPSLRSASSFDVKNECLFCGNFLFKRTKRNVDVYPVRTENQFLRSIKDKCISRNDEWSQDVLGRLEYCQDLHALEVKYHQQCSVNFRTNKNLPVGFDSLDEERKAKTRGRPVSSENKEAFEHIVAYIDTRYDETITIPSLVKEMEDFGLGVYTPQYLKRKLKEHYGDALFFSERDGKTDVVTVRENVSKILSGFHQSQEQASAETEKDNIISTAARLIKADVKALDSNKAQYPSAHTISSTDANLDFLPESIKLFLGELFAPLDDSTITAAIGQALTQAIRPKSMIAPLQLGLAVQIHHQTGSRQIVDILHNLGFCSSYYEVRMYEKNAAMESGKNGAGPNVADRCIQFVADNVDHNIETIDGLHTFHGMGMIAVHTPKRPSERIIPRREVSLEAVTEIAKIKIRFYNDTGKPAPLVYRALPVIDPLDSLSSADLLWKTAWIFNAKRPLWSGFMQTVLSGQEIGETSSVHFLPMIDLKPTDDSCIFSTLLYLAGQAQNFNITPVITFDQPLYWKAKIIIEKNQSDVILSSIVLRLGAFHTAMSFLGCIGHVMAGSGLEDALKVCYAPNTVSYVMNGKAYSRAVRAHQLIDTALHAILLSDIYNVNLPRVPTQEEAISEDDPDFGPEEVSDVESDIKKGMQRLADGVLDRSIPLDQICSNKHMKEIIQRLKMRRAESSTRKTAQLWFTYLDMVSLLRDFIRAERTGHWSLHLCTLTKMLPYFGATGHNLYLKCGYIYLTSMGQLQTDHPDVYQAFSAGHHVVRRTEHSWSGLSTDLTIEQTLMKSVKSTGGLTRGRGMDESQRALWVMSMPACAELNAAITAFVRLDGAKVYQHKDVGSSRNERDSDDTRKLAHYLAERNPFTGDSELRNISTGQVADATVTAHMAKEVGVKIIASMESENAMSFSFKKKNQLINMASKTCIHVKKQSVQVDPKLLFQRLIAVADLDIEEENIFEYELCSYPPALFEQSGLPLEANKPAIRDALMSFCKDHGEVTLEDDHYKYVLDGGSLLQRIPWTRGLTIRDLVEQYCTHVSRKYESAHIVFDGYDAGPSTKDITHLRRRGGGGVKITFELNSSFQTSKDAFLANDCNKQRFLYFLGEALERKGHTVIHAKQDADVTIALTALDISKQQATIVVGEDTDLLCLLCAHFHESCKDVYFMSAKQGGRVYNISCLARALGANSKRILFAHAILGCDTTSRLYGIGKGVAIKKLNDEIFKAVADVFLDPLAQEPDLIKAGEKALLIMYGFPSSTTLDRARRQRFKEKVAKSAVFVEPHSLPPTSPAAKFHSLRVYYQVQEWLNNKQRALVPTDWGFFFDNGVLRPIMTDRPPAPETLLAVVTCGCKTGCTTTRCTCRKHGLKCSTACMGCCGKDCSNAEEVDRSSYLSDDSADSETEDF